MKWLKHLWILILLFGLVSMSACGKPEEEPVNQEAVVDCAETIAAHQYLLMQHEELEGILKRSQEKQSQYATAVRILEDANLELGIELGILKGIEAGRAGNYENLLNELATLRDERKDWGRLAAKENEQLLENYNRLAALYPPAHFASDKELIEWRANTGNVTELGCLGLQRKAFADGYIVSVHPDLGYCLAIAGDCWYRITLGNQDLVEKIGG